MKLIELRKYKGITSAYVIVDDEDYEELNQHRWFLDYNGYVVRGTGRDRIYMHREIMEYPKKGVVDHVNRSKTDNRRSNLRICSIKENVRNAGLSKNSTSGINGVSYRKDRKRWRAYITVNRKQLSLGNFKTKEEAQVARQEGERRLW